MDVVQEDIQQIVTTTTKSVTPPATMTHAVDITDKSKPVSFYTLRLCKWMDGSKFDCLFYSRCLDPKHPLCRLLEMTIKGEV